MEMIGGLLKTASLAAITATAFAISGGMAPAKAADLGGNCCADLEERIAELEATTVRKGNRKVSVTLSGFVGHQVMWWDDGAISDAYIGDGGNYGSRFRFRGDAKISPTLTAGFLYEFGVANNSISSVNQTMFGDDLGGVAVPGILRDSTVWMRHSQWGMVKIGHGSTATDNLILIDLGGMAGAGTADIALYNGGFLFRNGNGDIATVGTVGGIWNSVLRGFESFDTSRRNHVLYETPTHFGFAIQAAVAEDNFWDVALRYAGEHHGFRLAFGIGYLEDTEFNLVSGGFPCTAQCNTKASRWLGSASALHVATGLFLTGAAGQQEISGNSLNNATDDATFWYLAGGVRRNFFGYGDTVLFGEYYNANDFFFQTRAVASSTTPFNGITGDDSASVWGIGVNQYIDAAAMEVFLVYKHFENDLLLNGLPVSDFDAVIGGARINF
jgi:hypothetical protein